MIKEAREAKGLSLEDIQAETRIRLKHLEAIEAGEWEKLPGEFYRRAFLSAFAAQVGLDSREVVNRYRRILGEQAAAEDENLEYLRRELSPVRMLRPRYFFLIGAGLIFLLLLAGAAYYYEWPAAIFPAAGEKGSPAPAVEKEVSPLLRVEAGGNARVRLYEMGTGRLLYQETLASGENREWVLTVDTVLKLNEAGGARVFFRGEEVQVQGRAGAEVTLEFPVGAGP